MYEYKMVQVPPTISVGTENKGDEAATYLSNIVNQSAKGGWEFQRIDSLGVSVTPGAFLAVKMSYIRIM